MILNVPYSSQKNAKTSFWQKNSCGIAALKMLLQFFGKKEPSLQRLIKQGLEKNGYSSAGWIHAALISIASDYGVELVSAEFKGINNDSSVKQLEKGIKQIVLSLSNGNPVLVSAVKKFSFPSKFHIIILTGYEKNKKGVTGFYYNDPYYLKTKHGKKRFVPIDIFRKYWRRLAIFVNSPTTSPTSSRATTRKTNKSAIN